MKTPAHISQDLLLIKDSLQHAAADLSRIEEGAPDAPDVQYSVGRSIGAIVAAIRCIDVAGETL